MIKKSHIILFFLIFTGCALGVRQNSPDSYQGMVNYGIELIEDEAIIVTPRGEDFISAPSGSIDYSEWLYKESITREFKSVKTYISYKAPSVLLVPRDR